ncbi:transporter substrate-binding domain-containing protein [Alteromonas flava]|uniref:transporter substrate-binding domain-containing protein n=1 Tax=Alteromonas flava TaxID=2048003 RepID=UPI000C28818C|nr:transporter substrate-binding domain-containing protein [Alteromonas flava]
MAQMLCRIFMIGVLCFIPLRSSGEVLQIGFYPIYPHVFENECTNMVDGAVVSFLNQHIAPFMNAEFDFKLLPLSRGLLELEKMRLDGFAALAKTEERSDIFRYPYNSFHQENAVLVVRKEHPLQSFNELSDIENYTVAYAQKAQVSNYMQQAKIQWVKISGLSLTERILQLVAIGRVDAGYTLIEQNSKRKASALGISSKLRFLQIPEEKRELYTVFANNNQAAQLQYDEAFEYIDGKTIYSNLLLGYSSAEKCQNEKH